MISKQYFRLSACASSHEVCRYDIGLQSNFLYHKKERCEGLFIALSCSLHIVPLLPPPSLQGTASLLPDFPPAVSPVSITDDAPSSTAQKISETSARVGTEFFSIDASICVTIINGFPALPCKRTPACLHHRKLPERHGIAEIAARDDDLVAVRQKLRQTLHTVHIFNFCQDRSSAAFSLSNASLRQQQVSALLHKRKHHTRHMILMSHLGYFADRSLSVSVFLLPRSPCNAILFLLCSRPPRSI